MLDCQVSSIYTVHDKMILMAYQMRRIERMADENPLRILALCNEFRGGDSRGGGSNDNIVPRFGV